MSSAISSPLSRARRHQRVEILQRAKLGMHRVHAALGRADGIGRADIARLCLQRIVAALAIGGADRVDRREVEHVEPPDRRRNRDGRSRLARCRAVAFPHGAGEKLVPGREGRRCRGRPRRAAARTGSGLRAARVRAHEAGGIVRQQRGDVAAVAALNERLQTGGLPARRLDLAQQRLRLLQLDGNVLPGRDLCARCRAPMSPRCRATRAPCSARGLWHRT